MYYRAATLLDRDGRELPVGLDLNAFGNGFGVAWIVKLPWLGTHLTFSGSAPIARVSVNTTRPEASIDRFGFGDVFLQPLKLGWRRQHLDAVVAYAIYLPTGQFELRGSEVGKGQVTNEFSAGGTVYFDQPKRWRFSALASYDLNSRKRGIDIIRGATILVQGGIGRRLVHILDVGVVGYGLWQVNDDRGQALPAVPRGARDRAFGVGAEVSGLIPPTRSRVTLRYVKEIGDRSRPEGHILLIGMTFVVWRPECD